MKTKFDEYLTSKIEQLKEDAKEVLSEYEQINSLIEDLEERLNKGQMSSKKIVKQSSHTAKGKTVTVKEQFKNYENASGTDIFLWGIDRLDNKEGTAVEIADVVAEMNIESVQKRLQSGTLLQWMHVSAQSLYKAKQIEKLKRSDRKGGVLFRKI